MTNTLRFHKTSILNYLALVLLAFSSSQVSAVGTAVRTYSGTDGVLNTFFYQCTGCHTGDGVGPGLNWDNYTQTSNNYGDSTWGIYYRVFITNDAPMYSGNALNQSHLTGWNTDGKLNYAAPYISTGSNGSNTRVSANNYNKAVSFTVNENGSNTTFTAYYRISGTWSQVSVTSPSGSGGGDTGSNTTANATLTGLTCGSTWTYYLSGTNTAGTSSGLASNSNTFSITCNTGATISGSPGTATEDSLFTWTPTISAGSGGSDNLTFSFSSGPTVTGGNTSNVPSINSSSGQVSWTPTEGNTSASFTILVSDSLADTGITDTLVVNITANAINDNNPVITTNGPLAATENTLMSTQINATDVDTVDTQTWDITASDDPDISISSSGLLTWTPAEGDGLIGSFDVTVRVTDAGANQTSKTLTINVASDNTAPTITTSPTSQTATEDLLYTIDIDATDPDAADTQTWTITDPIGLDNLAIDTNGVITWNPGEGIDRTQNITVQVEDSGGLTDDITFSVDVTAVNDAPVISVTIPNDSVEEHSAFSYAVQASDSDPQDNSPDLNSNLTYSITNVSPTPTSTTPSIDATGLITWTPGNNDARSVDPAALSQDYVISVSVADGGENSQGPATQDFTLTVTLLDGDSDTVPNYEDNCPVDANTTQDNNDLDSEGDVCDPDDDNDGISDIAENFNGLDPFDNSDAALDLDGDGLSNLNEFNTCTGGDINSLLTCDNIQIDSVPPIITHNGDFNLLAAGYTTFVDFSATATDGNDGVVNVIADTSNKFFRPGDNIVSWTAEDSVPNVAIEEQYITIHPLVSLGGSQVLAEGSSGIAYINFNGDIPVADFPVSITYAVTGASVTAGDYNITPASPIILNSQGDLSNGQVALNITATNDGLGEGSEIMTITLNGITTGPQFDLDITHSVMITEAQVAPTVNLVAEQNGITGNVIFGDQGVVTVNANAVDGNGDALTYDWSGSDAALGGSGVGGSYTFNPSSSVVPESFMVNVIVSDGTFNVSQSLSLVYAADSLALGGSDTDGDGVDDTTEGLNDSDGDGIPDYLDAYDNSLNLLYSGNDQSSDEGPEFIQTESGLMLALGAFGMESNVFTPNINLTKMTNQGLVVTDTGYVHFGSIYDFSISGLSLLSTTAQVVIPTDQGITPEAEIRLFDPILGVWFSFVENANNTISSAQSDENGCPAPGDASYTSGLSAYDHCIQLQISDGGPNDLDGEINGQILIIAGLAVIDSADLFEPEIVIDESNLFGSDGPAGTGSINSIFDMFLIAVLGAAFYRRRKLLVQMNRNI